MPTVGLSIADDAVSALELVPHGSSCRVGRFGRRPLPSGALSGGAIVNASAVAAELAALGRELELDFVRVSISEEKAYLYHTVLPPMERAAMRGALELSLEENVPLTPADAVFDFISDQRGETGNEVTVAVLPRAIAESYASLLAQVGLTPCSFSLETEAMARSLCPLETPETTLLVVVGRGATTFCMVEQGIPRFTSTVSVGCTPDIHAADVFSSCANAVSVLKDEIQKLSAYWQTHGEHHHAAFSRIVLAGSIAGFSGFDEYLARALEMPVAAGNVWVNAFPLGEYLPPIAFTDSFGYAAAVGLAL